MQRQYFLALAVAVLLATSASQAALFTYNFTGQVTEISDPNGLFTSPGAVGAPARAPKSAPKPGP